MASWKEYFWVSSLSPTPSRSLTHMLTDGKEKMELPMKPLTTAHMLFRSLNTLRISLWNKLAKISITFLLTKKRISIWSSITTLSALVRTLLKLITSKTTSSKEDEWPEGPETENRKDFQAGGETGRLLSVAIYWMTNRPTRGVIIVSYSLLFSLSPVDPRSFSNGLNRSSAEFEEYRADDPNLRT